MSASPTQIIIILLVVLIIFGAGKLPSVMGDIGKGVKNLKKGLNEADETIDLSNNSEQNITHKTMHNTGKHKQNKHKTHKNT